MDTSPHPGTYRKKEKGHQVDSHSSDFACLLILGGPMVAGPEIPGRVQVQKVRYKCKRARCKCKSGASAKDRLSGAGREGV